MWDQIVAVNVVPEQVGGEILAAEPFGEGVTLVDDAADGDMSAAEVAVRDMLEIPISVRVVQGPMLAELFPVVAPLHAMHHAEAAMVRAVKQVAAAVQVPAPSTVAAL